MAWRRMRGQGRGGQVGEWQGGGHLLWPLAFLLLAWPLGVFLAVRVPLGHVPDERNHALRAESLLHGAWIGSRLTIGHPLSVVLADPAIAAIITVPAHPMNHHPVVTTPAMRDLSEAVRWSAAPSLVDAGSIPGYMPALYIPGAVGVALVRLFGGTPARAFLAIRLADLLCFGLAGAAALRVARQARGLIAATLLLPMTLSLAASCNQDGLLIACAALAVACLQRRTTSWLVAAGALLALVIASKPPYAPLALLLLLGVSGKAGLAWRLGAACLVVAPGLVWTVLESWLVAVPVWRPPAEAGPLWPGPRPAIFAGTDFAAQLHVLAAGPWRVVTLPLATVARQASVLVDELVGVLDYLCLILPQGLYLAWFAALAGAMLAAMNEAPPWEGRGDRALAAGAVLLSLCAVGTALYLQWTPVGMDWVGGLQGRYFIPLLPVLAFVLPRLRSAAWPACLPLLAACADVADLPRIIATFYPSAPS